MPDIVGIGAVNLDVIVDARHGGSLDPAAPELRLSGFEQGVERRAPEAGVRRALRLVGAHAPHVCPGGSALNVVASVAAMATPLTAGYVGVCGRSIVDDFDFRDWFGAAGIDAGHVRHTDAPAGTCVAVMHAGERSLLTWGGANDQLDDHLRSTFDALSDYLSRARIVHVTSLAGDRDPAVLLRLLADVRRRNPALTLSVDPGALWAPPDRPRSVSQLLRLADVIFLNPAEFGVLTGRSPGVSDRDAARHWLERSASPRGALVLKRPDRVTVFHGLAGGTAGTTYRNPGVLDPAQIVDDTGAGDAFAAGFLAGTCLPGFETADGVELGLRLARAKLGFVGTTGIHGYRQEFRQQSAAVLARGSGPGTDGLSP